MRPLSITDDYPVATEKLPTGLIIGLWNRNKGPD